MDQAHWQYFISLDHDLEATVSFVEPVLDNFKTYSIEFAKILLSASSEVDVVCRVLAKQINPTARPDNINQHRKLILSRFPKFPQIRVLMPRYGHTFHPWKVWESEENPDWWTSYNDVKHKRYRHFPDANLRNSVSSLAGLLALLVYLYHDDLEHLSLHPWPTLLDIEKRATAFPFQNKFIVPDFEPEPVSGKT